jgi:hypothetical protein
MFHARKPRSVSLGSDNLRSSRGQIAFSPSSQLRSH